MGRMTFGHSFAGKLYVSRIHIDSGGYDQGGAYWGLGELIYAASSTKVGQAPDSSAFGTVRARNRAEAIRSFIKTFPSASFHRP